MRRKRSWVNGTLIILNIVYFLYLEIAGSSEDTLFMLRHGAMYTPLVIREREYYRLLTAVFMHFGINHIMNNMLVLFLLGDNLERALGRVKYLIFYLSCGVGANIVSLYAEAKKSMQVVGAGASGAVFGVVGGLLYIVVVNRGRLEDLSTHQLVVMVLFSLYSGFVRNGVNNVAHIAGLVIGIVLAIIFYKRPERPADPDVWEWE